MKNIGKLYRLLTFIMIDEKSNWICNILIAFWSWLINTSFFRIAIQTVHAF